LLYSVNHVLGTICFAGDARPKAGRPRVLEDTFREWRKLKSDMNLPDNYSVAQYLLNGLPPPTLTATSDRPKLIFPFKKNLCVMSFHTVNNDASSVNLPRLRQT